MRYGFTTGSAASAAAKAAAYMLLGGRRKNNITIKTPGGILYHAELEDIRIKEKSVSCAVCKDGGDDPDITTGAFIYAEVSLESVAPEGKTAKDIFENPHCKNASGKLSTRENDSRIKIDAGVGVGRVTKPGLNQPVGEAAINSVPRQMIRNEVLKVCRLFDYKEGLKVTISVQDGEKLAKKTFNPRLGIKGGISILGTTGIVEPMSTKALLDTIWIELKQKRELHMDAVSVTPGNYGMDFMKSKYGFDLDKSVKCSNYIGLTIDMVKKLGFKKMILTGHIGKLVKVSGGIMNTHSKEGDCRMELLCAAAVRVGADMTTLKKILQCVSTEEAVNILNKEGILSPVMYHITQRIQDNISHRAGNELQTECMIYSNDMGLLGKTTGAEKMLEELLTRNR